MYACNTDAQHLLAIRAPHKILLGRRSTRGLGAGALPQVGEAAALEAEPEIKKVLEDANLVFVTAGMGGGTGTGAAATIAQIAKEMGRLDGRSRDHAIQGRGTAPHGERGVGTGAVEERRRHGHRRPQRQACSNWCRGSR